MSDDAPPPETTTVSNALNAREVAWAKNSPELEAEHARINGPIIRTRFPPEPNGFLHIGHAKSMNMNFSLAFEKLGVPPEHRRTVFRYDDTNPAAEELEYIDSLRRDMEWLGWEPERTTYSSDNFRQLHEFAVQLIRRGLAYVCDMKKAEMEVQRDVARRRAMCRATGRDPDVEAPIPSPDILPGRNRDTSVERNLEMFENMRLGLYDEGSMTLRLKMDFESSNPNMYDLVAYRIKYTPHPHAGSGWCIYPSYDWTHGTCDSLEHIDYSICTLEFETRREPYYWILWALDLYRPKVYEMSRLNIEYTVLSKRRLLKLVNQKYVRGWDDPRMPTISGLRRRGYTAKILNSFCDDVGATRAMNVVEMEKLHHTARTHLAPTSRRVMAALDPIKVTITNWDEAVKQQEAEGGMTFEVPNSPTDKSLGSHTVTMTKVFYIDSSDFKLKDNPTYYGLAPNKAVGLKFHGGNLFCTDIVKQEGDKVVEIKCTLDKSEGRAKPKSFITWVPSDGLPAEVRVYSHLFTVPEPTDRWEEELNKNSEMIYPNAIVDPSVAEVCDKKHVDRWTSNAAVQFERFGYFVVDTDAAFDSASKSGALVFNRTVSLKEEVGKKELSDEEIKAIEERREKSKKDKEAKEARLQISPEDFFKLVPEHAGKYSKYKEDGKDKGLPTHLADGTELTKSAMKKLEKERQKHVKALMKASKK
eukprot:CAMPEP_0185810498 /NCGR_PEP_ID=MMETSP1322-20130828/6829_1 /TAXON_ID=265543 /ORGANISM="Minutocellus polymorphus, Strain RCC2270" /LENGTH=699 /DNA_ID=CAMNT_0028506815 /DNA_START=42 /DNA_END=2141 /DNA_ORIENTATION=+